MTLQLRHASRVARVVLSIGFVLAIAAQGQSPKVDSLVLHLRLSRERAADAVVAAFAQSGLGVTNTTTSLVESDQGATGGFSTTNRRIVRAVLFGPDSGITIVITGEEVRTDTESGILMKRLRIDNRAGGNGGKVWKKMVVAARMLDSASVPAAALPEE